MSVSTGIPELDKGLPGGGYPEGEMTFVSGEVGSGKTTLAVAATLAAIRNGRNVSLFVHAGTLVESIPGLEELCKPTIFRCYTLDEMRVFHKETQANLLIYDNPDLLEVWPERPEALGSQVLKAQDFGSADLLPKTRLLFCHSPRRRRALEVPSYARGARRSYSLECTAGIMSLRESTFHIEFQRPDFTPPVVVHASRFERILL